MQKLHIITPVKDSPETTLKTIESVVNSKINIEFTYTIYNDFSTEETTKALQSVTAKNGFNLINLADVTIHPSPNYLLVLQLAQEQAIYDNAQLIIIESDVIVNEDTIQKLYDHSISLAKPGFIASVTTDKNGVINFPYLYAVNYKSDILKTDKRLSFCCTLLTNNFLNAYDFKQLDTKKNWYDIFLSHKAVEMGFNNYLLTALPVLHLPHSSRPWKLLKYTNPLKYYWRKLLNNRDKI